MLGRSLLVSVVLHVAMVAVLLGGTLRAREATARVAEPIVPGAALAGDTFEVDAVRDEPLATREPRPAEPDEPKAEEPPLPPTPAPKPEPALSPQPKPKPKPRPSPPPEANDKPPADESEASEGAEASSEPQDEPARGARYGAAGLPPGVRHLATAFTKAVSAATNRDRLWDELPIGAVGKTRVVIDVDDDGRISHEPFDAEQPPPPALKRLVERTLALLRAGRFALSHDRPGAGREILEVDVTLSMVTPPEGEWDDPTHTAKIGFDPPAPGVPGRAYFVHASGRRFDALVTIVKAGR